MPNAELLQKTLEHIKENEAAWKQSVWREVPGLDIGMPQLLPTMCGTAMCFAGEAITIAEPDAWLISTDDIKKAIKAKSDAEVMRKIDNLIEKVKTDWQYSHSTETHPLTGERFNVTSASQYAEHLLDLTRDQAAILFHENNDLDDLEEMVNRLISGEALWDMDPEYKDDDDD